MRSHLVENKRCDARVLMVRIRRNKQKVEDACGFFTLVTSPSRRSSMRCGDYFSMNIWNNNGLKAGISVDVVVMVTDVSSDGVYV